MTDDFKKRFNALIEWKYYGGEYPFEVEQKNDNSTEKPLRTYNEHMDELKEEIFQFYDQFLEELKKEAYIEENGFEIEAKRWLDWIHKEGKEQDDLKHEGGLDGIVTVFSKKLSKIYNAGIIMLVEKYDRKGWKITTT